MPDELGEAKRGHARTMIVRALKDSFHITDDEAANLIAEATRECWILTIHHEYGLDTWVLGSEQDAYLRALEFSSQWLEDLREPDGNTFRVLVAERKLKEAVEFYFANTRAAENYIIEMKTVEIPVPLEPLGNPSTQEHVNDIEEGGSICGSLRCWCANTPPF